MVAIELFSVFLIGLFYYLNQLSNSRLIWFDVQISLDFITLIITTVVQLAILIGLFVTWYRNIFEISEQQIKHKSGILTLTEEIVTITSKNVKTEQTLLGSVFRYQTLILDTDSINYRYRIEDIPQQQVDDVINFLKAEKQDLQKDLSKKKTEQLLKTSEGDALEFKETLRYDVKIKKFNRDLEKTVIKSLAAFMNNSGGVLIVGVTDQGKVLGLKRDFDSLKKKNKDGFEIHLNQIIDKYIGAQFRHLLDIKFETVNKKIVCRINVKQANEPIFIDFGDQEHFFLRTGNTTTSLGLSKAYAYITSRFKRPLLG